MKMSLFETSYKKKIRNKEILFHHIHFFLDIPVYSQSYSTFWALQGDYEHEIIQPWLPVSQEYK